MSEEKKLSDRLVFSIVVVIVFHLFIIKIIDSNYEDNIQSNLEQRSFQIKLLSPEVLVPEHEPAPEVISVDSNIQQIFSAELGKSNLKSTEVSKVEDFVGDEVTQSAPQTTNRQVVSSKDVELTGTLAQTDDIVVVSQQDITEFARSKAKSMFQDMWKTSDSGIDSKNINVNLSEYNEQIDFSNNGNDSEIRTVVEGTFHKAESEVEKTLRSNNDIVSFMGINEQDNKKLIVNNKIHPIIEPSDISQSENNSIIASSISIVEWDSPGEGREILEQRDPVIPGDIPLQGVTYRVVVLFRLLPSGLLSGFRVIEGSGIAEIDAAVVESLRKWRFVASPRAEVVNGKIPFIVKIRR